MKDYGAGCAKYVSGLKAVSHSLSTLTPHHEWEVFAVRNRSVAFGRFQNTLASSCCRRRVMRPQYHCHLSSRILLREHDKALTATLAGSDRNQIIVLVKADRSNLVS